MRRLLVLPIVAILATMPARAAGAVEYVPPLRGAIIRHFEPPPTPYAPGHRGIDIAAPLGTTVVASAGGVVAFAGPVAGELFVSIDHADGIRTTYSFLQEVLVRKGDAVAQRDPIARSSAGHAGSAEPHLHFGARIGDDYIDPEALLVARFRRDYSELIRLAPVEEDAVAHGRVPGPGGWSGWALAAVVVPRPGRRRRRG